MNSWRVSLQPLAPSQATHGGHTTGLELFPAHGCNKAKLFDFMGIPRLLFEALLPAGNKILPLPFSAPRSNYCNF